MTGASQLNVEVSGKRLELMHELLPAATTMALLVNPEARSGGCLEGVWKRQLPAGFKLHMVRGAGEGDLSGAFEMLVQLKAEALVIGTDTLFNSESETISQIGDPPSHSDGLSISRIHECWWVNELWRQCDRFYRLAGGYVGRILKGEKPSNLPVQQVTKVELLLNLKTAKAIGINEPYPGQSR